MSLLDPAWLSRLSRLSLPSRVRATGQRLGTHRSPRKGRSMEFADHRPYVEGDDLRTLDWHLYARLDSLWIRRYHEEEDRTVLLVLDSSASMEGPNLDLAQRLAACLCWVGLQAGERVGVVQFDEAVQHYAPPRRGRGKVRELLDVLEAVQATGGTDLSQALSRWPRQRGGQLCIVLSDFHWPDGPEQGLERLAAGREVIAVHLVDPGERDPDLEGEVVLVDAETGEEVALRIDEEAMERYRDAHDAHLEDVRRAAGRLGIPLVQVDADQAVEDVVFRELRRVGVLR